MSDVNGKRRRDEDKPTNGYDSGEDGEISDGGRKTSDSKDKRKKSKHSKDGKKHKGSKHKSKRKDSGSDRSKSRSRSRSKGRRERDRKERGERDRGRDDRRDRGRGRSADRGRGRSADRGRRSDSRDRDRGRRARSPNDPEKTKVSKKTPQEIAAEKAAEEEYKRRVEEQMKSLNDDSDEEDDEAKEAREAEERKRRRAELLAKFKKPVEEDARSKSAEKEETIENMSKLKHIQSEDDIKALRRKIQLKEDAATLREVGPDGVEGAEEEKEEEEEAPDMFTDSIDKLAVRQTAQHGTDDTNLLDNWDDHEGYYRFRLGDMLSDRYRVVANQGRGVFSSVSRVRDTVFGNRELVIKVIRNNDTMYRAGLKELELLKILAANDVENKKHCIRLTGHFEHHGHLCLVFEPMAMNLREVVKKLGGKGLNIKAVRSFAKQLFTSLRHIKKCGIVHGDIKPDNILVSENMNMVKLCDLGSAGKTNECEITPYLVSRFYRAPEIMVGLPYAEPIDVWSMCAVLYELYTGKILFPGKDNNDMLRLIIEIKGNWPNRKILRNAQFSERHFEPNGDFKMQLVDKLTKSVLTKVVRAEKPTRNLHDMLKKYAAQGMKEEDRIKVSQLADLLEKGFMLDPARRLSVEQALHHPFIRED